MRNENSWSNLGKLTNATKARDVIAIVDCSSEGVPLMLTHGQLDDLADACARGLLARGYRRGDAIGLMSANCAEFLIAYLAILRAGMIAVPVNHKLSSETVSFILADCGAKAVFVDDPRIGLVPAGVDGMPLNGPVWDALLDFGPFDAIEPERDECAMILYTSGSTGRPKGVQLSHDGQIWTVKARFATRQSFDEERMIVAAPLFHMNALAACKFALSAHASVVLMPQFQAKTFIEAIGKFSVTWVTSVPTMMAMVVRETDALASIDTSAVRYVRMGSAPATPQLYAAVQAAFPNATIAGGYGTTEGGPITFGPTQGRKLPVGGGLGWPLPGVEARLINESGQDAHEGELWLRTPANMSGYLNMPERTAEVLTPDGWYKTGDIFKCDANGCFHFVGRADDMFNCGGENIYPGEVEQVIEKMPEVLQACVLPVPDEIKGQKPVAFVVLRDGQHVTEEDIKRFTLANAPAYQHPRRVYFIDAMPLAATNKIDRNALRVRIPD